MLALLFKAPILQAASPVAGHALAEWTGLDTTGAGDRSARYALALKARAVLTCSNWLLSLPRWGRTLLQGMGSIRRSW